jgi:hypothetical protein
MFEAMFASAVLRARSVTSAPVDAEKPSTGFQLTTAYVRLVAVRVLRQEGSSEQDPTPRVVHRASHHPGNLRNTRSKHDRWRHLYVRANAQAVCSAQTTDKHVNPVRGGVQYSNGELALGIYPVLEPLEFRDRLFFSGATGLESFVELGIPERLIAVRKANDRVHYLGPGVYPVVLCAECHPAPR